MCRSWTVRARPSSPTRSRPTRISQERFLQAAQHGAILGDVVGRVGDLFGERGERLGLAVAVERDADSGGAGVALARAVGVNKKFYRHRGIVPGMEASPLENPPLYGTVSGDPPPAFTFAPLVPPPPPGKTRCPLAKGSTEENLAMEWRSVEALARALRAGQTSSVELTRFFLERLKTYGPRLNCVVSLIDEEIALAEAAKLDAEGAAGNWRGTLHGIPYGLKDLFAARGIRTTFGAKPYENQVLDFDSTVTARLRDAGAVLVAKLSMGELAYGDDWFGGKTRTPWNPEIGSSGSSAGSAAAVAAGLVPFAIGTETWGSLISPSLRCGTSSLRPTFGRVPRTGAMALSWTMDKVGPLCRSTADCAHVFAAIHGADPGDPASVTAPFSFSTRRSVLGLRVGIDEASFAEATESQRAILGALEKLGVQLVPIALPESNPALDQVGMRTIQVEAASSFAELLASGKVDELQPVSYRDWPKLLKAGRDSSAAEYVSAQRVRRRLMEAMEPVFSDIDAYVTVPGAGNSLMFTNLTGHPEAITRCGHREEGFPEMISFVGALWRDETVLALAHAVDRATRAHRRWPDVSKLPVTPPEPRAE